MKKERRAADATPLNNTATKVQQIKGIEKILAYFRYKAEGSTLSISDATGVARCSVCYYIADLLNMDVVGYCGRKVGRTGRMMKNYTTDRKKWLKRQANTQLSLFPLWEKGGGDER
jgi:hypothetical protein